MYRCFYFAINNDDFDFVSIHFSRLSSNFPSTIYNNNNKEDEKHKPIGFIAEWMNAYIFISRKLNNNHRKVKCVHNHISEK